MDSRLTPAELVGCNSIIVQNILEHLSVNELKSHRQVDSIWNNACRSKFTCVTLDSLERIEKFNEDFANLVHPLAFSCFKLPDDESADGNGLYLLPGNDLHGNECLNLDAEKHLCHFVRNHGHSVKKLTCSADIARLAELLAFLIRFENLSELSLVVQYSVDWEEKPEYFDDFEKFQVTLKLQRLKVAFCYYDNGTEVQLEGDEEHDRETKCYQHMATVLMAAAPSLKYLEFDVHCLLTQLTPLIKERPSVLVQFGGLLTGEERTKQFLTRYNPFRFTQMNIKIQHKHEAEQLLQLLQSQRDTLRYLKLVVNLSAFQTEEHPKPLFQLPLELPQLTTFDLQVEDSTNASDEYAKPYVPCMNVPKVFPKLRNFSFDSENKIIYHQLYKSFFQFEGNSPCSTVHTCGFRISKACGEARNQVLGRVETNFPSLIWFVGNGTKRKWKEIKEEYIKALK